MQFNIFFLECLLFMDDFILRVHPSIKQIYWYTRIIINIMLTFWWNVYLLNVYLFIGEHISMVSLSLMSIHFHSVNNHVIVRTDGLERVRRHAAEGIVWHVATSSRLLQEVAELDMVTNYSATVVVELSPKWFWVVGKTIDVWYKSINVWYSFYILNDKVAV